MKKYKCPVCGESSCGDDYHTVTKYQGPEMAIGDRIKVIMLQVSDASELDNLQPYEIKALINALIDEHLEESE
jgi:hypothetical protein